MLSLQISPITDVLLADLGLSIPLSFMDKCISTSIDSLFIDSTLLKCPIFHPYLIYFHRQIQGIKSFRNVKQAARFSLRKILERCVWHMSALSLRNMLAFHIDYDFRTAFKVHTVLILNVV